MASRVAQPSSSSATKPTIDRQSTTPFHLKLFYRLNAFHHLSDFPIPPSPLLNSSNRRRRSDARAASPPPPIVPLPAHLQIYTWQSCTLRELSQLLTTALPSLLPNPAVGTRLCFRLIYPDTRAAAMMGPDARGRYLSKDVGSVVIGLSSTSPTSTSGAINEREERRGSATNNNAAGNSTSVDVGAGLRFTGNEADKTLQEMRFVIGDYVDCAILPPLDDGSVAPPLVTGRGGLASGPPGGGSTIGGGMRAFRENGFGGGGGGGRFGRGGGRGGGGAAVIPSGDWRRGERLPEGAGGGRGSGRRGWAPY